MGKSNKPVRILILGMSMPPELEALKTQGHVVQECAIYHGDEECEGEDWIVLGPKCWRWLPDISAKWLPLILKEARASQPKKETSTAQPRGGKGSGKGKK